MKKTRRKGLIPSSQIEVSSVKKVLEYSRSFHIYNTGTTPKVWIRIGFVWKVFGSMEVETMTCKDEWLGAAEMFCEDS